MLCRRVAARAVATVGTGSNTVGRVHCWISKDRSSGQERGAAPLGPPARRITQVEDVCASAVGVRWPILIRVDALCEGADAVCGGCRRSGRRRGLDDVAARGERRRWRRRRWRRRRWWRRRWRRADVVARELGMTTGHTICVAPGALAVPARPCQDARATAGIV